MSFKRADQMKREVYIVKFQRKYRMLVIKVEDCYSVLSMTRGSSITPSPYEIGVMGCRPSPELNEADVASRM